MRSALMIVTIGLLVAGCAGEPERDAVDAVVMPVSCRTGNMQLCMQELSRQNQARTGATPDQQQIINKFMQDMMGGGGMTPPQSGQPEDARSQQQIPQEQSSQKQKPGTPLDLIPDVPQPPVPQITPDMTLPGVAPDLPGTTMPAEEQNLLEETQTLRQPQEATTPPAP